MQDKLSCSLQDVIDKHWKRPVKNVQEGAAPNAKAVSQKGGGGKVNARNRKLKNRQGQPNGGPLGVVKGKVNGFRQRANNVKGVIKKGLKKGKARGSVMQGGGNPNRGMGNSPQKQVLRGMAFTQRLRKLNRLKNRKNGRQQVMGATQQKFLANSGGPAVRKPSRKGKGKGNRPFNMGFARRSLARTAGKGKGNLGKGQGRTSPVQAPTGPANWKRVRKSNLKRKRAPLGMKGGGRAPDNVGGMRAWDDMRTPFKGFGKGGGGSAANRKKGGMMAIGGKGGVNRRKGGMSFGGGKGGAGRRKGGMIIRSGKGGAKRKKGGMMALGGKGIAWNSGKNGKGQGKFGMKGGGGKRGGGKGNFQGMGGRRQRRFY